MKLRGERCGLTLPPSLFATRRDTGAAEEDADMSCAQPMVLYIKEIIYTRSSCPRQFIHFKRFLFQHENMTSPHDFTLLLPLLSLLPHYPSLFQPGCEQLWAKRKSCLGQSVQGLGSAFFLSFFFQILCFHLCCTAFSFTSAESRFSLEFRTNSSAKSTSTETLTEIKLYQAVHDAC